MNNYFADDHTDIFDSDATRSSFLGAGFDPMISDISFSGLGPLDFAAGQPFVFDAHNAPAFDEHEEERYFDFTVDSARHRTRARDAASELTESLATVRAIDFSETPVAHNAPVFDEHAEQRYSDFTFDSAGYRARARDAAFEPRESLGLVWDAESLEDPAAAAQVTEAHAQELFNAGFFWSVGSDGVDNSSESASHEQTAEDPDKYGLVFDEDQKLWKTDNLSPEAEIEALGRNRQLLRLYGQERTTKSKSKSNPFGFSPQPCQSGLTTWPGYISEPEVSRLTSARDYPYFDWDRPDLNGCEEGEVNASLIDGYCPAYNMVDVFGTEVFFFDPREPEQHQVITLCGPFCKCMHQSTSSSPKDIYTQDGKTTTLESIIS